MLEKPNVAWSPSRERVVESNIVGKGTLTLCSQTASNAVRQVRYPLDVYQQMLGTNDAFPGAKEVRGTIAPVYFVGRDDGTLQLEDGRSLRLIVSDAAGTVESVEPWQQKVQTT